VKAAQNGNPEAGIHFFEIEYRLNYALANLSKPHVALLDGIVMGGGAGVSIHGCFRHATLQSLHLINWTSRLCQWRQHSSVCTRLVRHADASAAIAEC
jgi:hypothetical protein